MTAQAALTHSIARQKHNIKLLGFQEFKITVGVPFSTLPFPLLFPFSQFLYHLIPTKSRQSVREALNSQNRALYTTVNACDNKKFDNADQTRFIRFKNKKLCCRKKAARCFVSVQFMYTRMVWLPDGEKKSNICLFVLTQSTNVSDTHTQTDRQTDRHRMTAQAALTHSIARQKLKTIECSNSEERLSTSGIA